MSKINMKTTKIYGECYFCHRKTEVRPEEFEDYINGRFYPIGEKCLRRANKDYLNREF